MPTESLVPLELSFSSLSLRKYIIDYLKIPEDHYISMDRYEVLTQVFFVYLIGFVCERFILQNSLNRRQQQQLLLKYFLVSKHFL